VNKTAIITGVTGQDGMYLSKLLLNKGYQIIGLVRGGINESIPGFSYLGIEGKVRLELCDLHDITQIINLIKKYNPSEIYNLAAQSSVGQSFSQPIGTIQFNINSVLNLLEAIKIVGQPIRFYQASSSEMYGRVTHLPINEETPFHPLSPYAVSKAAGHWVATNYREAYGLFTACGILFNHESHLRKHNFFVKKVISESINIAQGKQDKLLVGNIDIRRDFGYAPAYVEAMWLMLQKEKAEDFLICSGKSVSLRRIVEYVFGKLEISLDRLEVSHDLYRPTEIEDIYGDNRKARLELGWEYDIEFEQVLDSMIEEEVAHQIKMVNNLQS
jgi:GDPmannose 4,6-dehydratase